MIYFPKNKVNRKVFLKQKEGGGVDLGRAYDVKGPAEEEKKQLNKEHKKERVSGVEEE